MLFRSELYLKTENLQITGSFKVRGSYYKMSRLTPEEKARGVIACSAGNHAQGVALAAQKNGIKAVICLPDGAPISKVEATKSYGAEVCLVEGVYDDAYRRALELRDEKGYSFIHPFNDEDVIAGQGTIALELAEQLPNMDAVIVPVGGGGLISGIAFTLKSLNPNVKVYGVQAAGAPSMHNSLRDGKIETLSGVSTIADGIAVKQPGDLTDIPRHGVYTEFDSRLLEDASFLRLKNVMLSYSVPEKWIRKTRVFTAARIYVQGQNLLTFTKFSGLDPEGTSNIYAAQYPMSRQYTVGLDLKF